MEFKINLPEEGFKPSLAEEIEVGGKQVTLLSCPCSAAEREDAIGYFFHLLLQHLFKGKCWCEEEEEP